MVFLLCGISTWVFFSSYEKNTFTRLKQRLVDHQFSSNSIAHCLLMFVLVCWIVWFMHAIQHCLAFTEIIKLAGPHLSRMSAELLSFRSRCRVYSCSECSWVFVINAVQRACHYSWEPAPESAHDNGSFAVSGMHSFSCTLPCPCKNTKAEKWLPSRENNCCLSCMRAIIQFPLLRSTKSLILYDSKVRSATMFSLHVADSFVQHHLLKCALFSSIDGCHFGLFIAELKICITK